MATSMKAVLTEYKTFESREAAFNTAVGHLIPARYMGPQRFWREFRRITEIHGGMGGGTGHRDRLPAYITSNPRDCLAFGTVSQVLAAARHTFSGPARPSADLEPLVEDFGLQRAEHQPLRTLSGGETVRLALAKTMLAAAAGRRLVIASPFCWLSRRHQPLLDKVLDRFSEKHLPVDVLIMQGESRQDVISPDRLCRLDLAHLDFTLRLHGLKIDLGTPINTITARPAYARVNDLDTGLTSPCLLVGDNGQGKSLVAKALCSAIDYRGAASMTCATMAGRGRLLFQDVVTQTLLRSFKEICRIDGSTMAGDLFGELFALQRQIRQDGAWPDASALSSESPASLLAVKTMLIAVRLALKPAALILDEPDWGLSRDDAVGLVLAVIVKAHRLGVPVILISHKPWWHSVAGSVVEVSKTMPVDPAEAANQGHRDVVFTIDLRCQPRTGRRLP